MYNVFQRQTNSYWPLIGLLAFLILNPSSVNCFILTRSKNGRNTNDVYLNVAKALPTRNADIFQLIQEDSPESDNSLDFEDRNHQLLYSRNQHMSIQSSSPAVLLKSGPGTGKTYTLASRVAYLLKTKKCPPEKMVIMSFSNRDAELLKTKALDLFEEEDAQSSSLPLFRKDVNDRLWSGTIHKFSSNIIRTCSAKSKPLRVVSSKESRARIDRCLRQLMDENFHRRQGPNWRERTKHAQLLNRDALIELRQSRSVLIHQIGRCVELWKESSMLPPPSINGISCSIDAKEGQENCMELATRLGMTRNVACLAWNMFPLLQDLHEKQGTADPADLASIAFHLLLSQPEQLSKIRTKLRHVILDEYQDVSVSQYKLIRLIIRGIVDEFDISTTKLPSKPYVKVPPVLVSVEENAKSQDASNFDVPRLFCAGDSQQSIYGFRGAAPTLSVDGFRNDFPQGVITEIETNFRLSSSIWSVANSLTGKCSNKSSVVAFDESPVGKSRSHQLLSETLGHLADTKSLAKLLSENQIHDTTSNVHIQGLWDEREEAKYIAMMIKRRSKDRIKFFTKAIKSKTFVTKNETVVPAEDPTSVAIIVRGENQLSLIIEALEKKGIPYRKKNEQTSTSTDGAKSLAMKPVTLTSAHGAKGEEYDDVFLPGWTEGVFPHPSAVSSNRVDEERRLAFVAISRASNQVIITHSFIRRAQHHGPHLRSKKVTMQVRPSRFLYELVPNGEYLTDDRVDNCEAVEHNQYENLLPIVTWDRSPGSKGAMAGSNLPGFFQKSYQTPNGFTAPEHPEQELLIIERQLEMLKTRPVRWHYVTKPGGVGKAHPKRSSRIAKDNTQSSTHKQKKPTGGEDIDQAFSIINRILRKEKGGASNAKMRFRELLKSHLAIKRGRITLLSFEEEVKSMPELTYSTFETLVSSSMFKVGTRPMSHATALQLGLFYIYSLYEEELLSLPD